MMFDPPDYSYKDLSKTYDTDNFLLNNNSDVVNQPLDSEKKESLLTNITETQITLQSNDSGRYFDGESSTFSDSIIDQNVELYLSQPEFLLNTAPSLLDDNTINQYLLPLPDSTIDKAMDFIDISTMHACVICNEIFANEIDLMNHSISFHSSSDVLYQNECNLLSTNEIISCNEENNNNGIKFGADWLVCGICKRVLSALEGDPNDQLCCLDDNGDSNVLSQNLVTMYVCDFCNGLFANAEALNSHKIACVNENSKDLTEETVDTDVKQSSQLPEVCYSCDICGQQYSSVNELKDHSTQCPKPKTGRRFYRNINKNKMWNCGSCNQLFATARELYRHKRGEDRPEGTSQTAYTCEECDKELPSMCALHTHKKMHKVLKPADPGPEDPAEVSILTPPLHGEAKDKNTEAESAMRHKQGYPCGICGRRFNQSGHLAIHMRMHTGERPYPCDLCPKAFKVKVERDDHRRTHTGERPFACPLCPKTFTAAARLREHSRIHTDQRPYRCDICDAAFRRPYARTVHTLIHTGEKPHECDICGTAFRRSGDMWKHKRTIHGILPSLVDNKKIVKT